MICACGNLFATIDRELRRMTLFLSTGVATIRPVALTVRVEHLDCGDCRGYLIHHFDDPRTALIPGGCGCQDQTVVEPSMPAPAPVEVIQVPADVEPPPQTLEEAVARVLAGTAPPEGTPPREEFRGELACWCGALVLEGARDGSLVAQGSGIVHVWQDHATGDMVFVGASCHACGDVDLAPAPVPPPPSDDKKPKKIKPAKG